MLKRRIVVLLTFVAGSLVRTKRFVADRWLSHRDLGLSGADELVCLRVGGSEDEFFGVVRELADDLMIPVSVGGGIRDLAAVERVFRETPADKVVLGPSGWGLAREIGERYGRQACVCGFADGLGPERPVWEDFGEILFQSVERDGSLMGYDLAAIPRFAGFGLPLVVGSGCGRAVHMAEGFAAGADGCATSNILHFSGAGLAGFRAQLSKAGVAVRQ